MEIFMFIRKQRKELPAQNNPRTPCDGQELFESPALLTAMDGGYADLRKKSAAIRGGRPRG